MPRLAPVISTVGVVAAEVMLAIVTEKTVSATTSNRFMWSPVSTVAGGGGG